MPHETISFFLSILTTKSIISIFLVVAITLAIIIDLYFGVKKAKQAGDYTTSTGLKETTKKAQLYYGVFLMTFLIDAIFIIAAIHVKIFEFPVLCSLWSIYIIATEAFSVYEKADKKMRRKKEQQAKELVQMLSAVKENIDKITPNRLKDEDYIS